MLLPPSMISALSSRVRVGLTLAAGLAYLDGNAAAAGGRVFLLSRPLQPA